MSGDWDEPKKIERPVEFDHGVQGLIVAMIARAACKRIEKNGT